MTSTIPIRNLYYLYAYAWDQFYFARRVDTGVEAGPDAAPFLATVLVRGAQQVFRRCVDHFYLSVDEERAQLRGRIKALKTERAQSLQRGRVWCEFDEFTHNSLANQIIKASLHKLKKHKNISSVLATDIRKVLQTFDQLGVKDVKISRQDFRRVQLNRNNAFYSFLLHVCELAYEALFPDEKGEGRQFASLLEDETRMCRIFERFIRNFYRQEQTLFSVTTERIVWDVTDGDRFVSNLMPVMQTDVSLRNDHRTIIVDAKFYVQTLQSRFNHETVRSAHLYQLFAYVKNLERNSDVDKRAEGILIYPKVQGQLDFQTCIQGHKMQAKTVDLSVEWPSVREQLLSIIH